jgi:branched-chain amino acid transport system substrate-binding protein
MQVIQTFTFIGNRRPAAMRLAQWILKDAQLTSVDQIPAPAGSAHAYDMTHLLALGVNKARSTRGDDIRKALENLPPHEGAVRRYAPAFTETSHDALTPREVLFVRFGRGGQLTPVR